MQHFVNNRHLPFGLGLGSAFVVAVYTSTLIFLAGIVLLLIDPKCDAFALSMISFLIIVVVTPMAALLSGIFTGVMANRRVAENKPIRVLLILLPTLLVGMAVFWMTIIGATAFRGEICP